VKKEQSFWLRQERTHLLHRRNPEPVPGYLRVRIQDLTNWSIAVYRQRWQNVVDSKKTTLSMQLSKRKHNTHYFINESVSLATIKEVAALAGVSFKTVSRVLNDDANVSSATREKVLYAIEQLDYRPNLAARYMRTGRSQLIGFITDEIAILP
jgi:transcriptional regulator with XRE-family HTH domain